MALNNGGRRETPGQRRARERREREAAERARQEAARRAREEAERAKQEAERKAREEAEAKKREEQQKRDYINAQWRDIALGQVDIGIANGSVEIYDAGREPTDADRNSLRDKLKKAADAAANSTEGLAEFAKQFEGLNFEQTQELGRKLYQERVSQPSQDAQKRLSDAREKYLKRKASSGDDGNRQELLQKTEAARREQANRNWAAAVARQVDIFRDNLTAYVYEASEGSRAKYEVEADVADHLATRGAEVETQNLTEEKFNDYWNSVKHLTLQELQQRAQTEETSDAGHIADAEQRLTTAKEEWQKRRDAYKVEEERQRKEGLQPPAPTGNPPTPEFPPLPPRVQLDEVEWMLAESSLATTLVLEADGWYLSVVDVRAADEYGTRETEPDFYIYESGQDLPLVDQYGLNIYHQGVLKYHSGWEFLRPLNLPLEYPGIPLYRKGTREAEEHFYPFRVIHSGGRPYIDDMLRDDRMKAFTGYSHRKFVGKSRLVSLNNTFSTSYTGRGGPAYLNGVKATVASFVNKDGQFCWGVAAAWMASASYVQLDANGNRPPPRYEKRVYVDYTSRCKTPAPGFEPIIVAERPVL